jgi:hypothetical protein
VARDLRRRRLHLRAWRARRSDDRHLTAALSRLPPGERSR